MNTISDHFNDETNTGQRPVSMPDEKWNQQTTVDARNVLHIQQSVDCLQQQFHQQYSTKMHKQQSYPTHILHPEEIPSLNDVQDQLNKRRNSRLEHQLTLETDEGEMPMIAASALQDELQRAVQNRAAHDRNIEQVLPDNFESAFKPVESPCQSRESHGFERQNTVFSHGLSHDRIILNETFQRIKIAGEFRDLSHIEDLEESVAPLLRALVIREKYMAFSLQSFPLTLADFLKKILENNDQSRRTSSSINRLHNELKHKKYSTSSIIQSSLKHLEQSLLPLPQTLFQLLSSYSIDETNDDNYGGNDSVHPPVIKREDSFNIPLLPSMDISFKIVKGIFCIYILNDDKQWILADYPIIDRNEFIDDYNLLSTMIADGPLKSFCYRRLQYLKSKYELHCLLNEVKEWTAIKSTPHRDFYNVRKVDTHIHAASSMNQKHLLRFMKKKMKNSGNLHVYKTKDGKLMTLKEVCDELEINPDDLSVDMLGVHADRNTFQRFDRFNAKYNPVGQSILREIFLKTDNYIDGVFFADLLKEMILDLEDNKYQHAEPRVSIYGKSSDEWDKLAKWAVTNTMYSANIAWMVQIPRLYDVYRANGIIKNFQEFLNNLFKPLFEATIDPQSHPDLFRFMHHLTGFDSVDDETKPEKPILTMDMFEPEQWNISDNPPYVYYLFYMYANILTLNQLRQARGLNTYQFRPHCGEAGAVTHLIAAYMVAENISHGLLLRKSPVLQYLFYLCQIGIAMSPLSNNSLFINYNRNPMLEYFERGLCVSLSTDDPMQFHFTKEPLMEEYSIAAQVWKLSSVDMCELARNSVLMSGFSREVKMYWLGPNYEEPGVPGNDIRRTNVPSIRIAYRYEALCEELRLLTLGYRNPQRKYSFPIYPSPPRVSLSTHQENPEQEK